VIIPAAVNGAVLALPACDFTQLKSDSRAFVSKSNDVLLTIAGDLQQEVGKKGRSRAATNLVLDGLSRIAAVRGTGDQDPTVTALVFNRMVKGWLACAEDSFTAGALEPDPPLTSDNVGGFGPALGSHWVFEVRGKTSTDGAYERNKPPVGTMFWALEPGAADWGSSIGGSLRLDRVFIYGYQTGNPSIPAKFGSSFDHRTIPKISDPKDKNPTFTLSVKAGLCGLDAQDGRRVNHDNVFLPLVTGFQCLPPAAIDAGSSIYAFRLLNPMSLAQRAIDFLGPKQLYAALGVVGSRPKGLSPSAVYDLSQYQLGGLGTISDGNNKVQLHLVTPANAPVTVHVTVPGANPGDPPVDAPVGTPVAISILGNSSSIAYFADGSANATPTPTVTRLVGDNGIVSFDNVFLVKAGGYQLAFRVSLSTETGGIDFQGAQVLVSNSFQNQNKK
jgi:hypothetical protein